MVLIVLKLDEKTESSVRRDRFLFRKAFWTRLRNLGPVLKCLRPVYMYRIRLRNLGPVFAHLISRIRKESRLGVSDPYFLIGGNRQTLHCALFQKVVEVWLTNFNLF